MVSTSWCPYLAQKEASWLCGVMSLSGFRVDGSVFIYLVMKGGIGLELTWSRPCCLPNARESLLNWVVHLLHRTARKRGDHLGCEVVRLGVGLQTRRQRSPSQRRICVGGSSRIGRRKPGVLALNGR